MCFLFWGWLVQRTGPDLGGGTPLHTNTKGANGQIGKVGTRFQRQMGVGWGVRVCRFQIGLRAPSVRWASDGRQMGALFANLNLYLGVGQPIKVDL